ncbi:hypothetical protein ON010_g13668 [Phytophthora cinnamomi]|nr:hypothetical protein ON010_g13668 [Phytophthora cinnamomi]
MYRSPRSRRDHGVAAKVSDYAFKLEISGTDYRLFPVVHISKLKPVRQFPERPAEQATIDESERFDFDEALLPEDSWEAQTRGGDVYEVEEFLDVKSEKRTRYGRHLMKYHVRWKNYPEPQWIKEEDLTCGGLLSDYQRRRRSQQRFRVMQSRGEADIAEEYGVEKSERAGYQIWTTSGQRVMMMSAQKQCPQGRATGHMDLEISAEIAALEVSAERMSVRWPRKRVLRESRDWGDGENGLDLRRRQPAVFYRRNAAGDDRRYGRSRRERYLDRHAAQGSAREDHLLNGLTRRGGGCGIVGRELTETDQKVVRKSRECGFPVFKETRDQVSRDEVECGDRPGICGDT